MHPSRCLMPRNSSMYIRYLHIYIRNYPVFGNACVDYGVLFLLSIKKQVHEYMLWRVYLNCCKHVWLWNLISCLLFSLFIVHSINVRECRHFGRHIRQWHWKFTFFVCVTSISFCFHQSIFFIPYLAPFYVYFSLLIFLFCVFISSATPRVFLIPIYFVTKKQISHEISHFRKREL